METVPPGAVIIYAPDTPQWFRSPELLTHDWMHMTGDVESFLLAAGLESDKLYYPVNGAFITPILRQIELEVLTKQPDSEVLSNLKFRELLLLLRRSCAGQEEKPDSAAVKQLRLVRRTVFAQLDQPWTVSQMATLAYLSPSRFHALYRAAFGVSPIHYLNVCRYERARTLLAETDLSVTEIAAATGFSSIHYFSRAFSASAGVSPYEYRRRHRAGTLEESTEK